MLWFMLWLWLRVRVKVLTEMPLPSGEVQRRPLPLVRQARVRPGTEEHLDHLHVALPGGQADGLFSHDGLSCAR